MERTLTANMHRQAMKNFIECRDGFQQALEELRKDEPDELKVTVLIGKLSRMSRIAEQYQATLEQG